MAKVPDLIISLVAAHIHILGAAAVAMQSKDRAEGAELEPSHNQLAKDPVHMRASVTLWRVQFIGPTWRMQVAGCSTHGSVVSPP